jgi:elongation factor 3
LFKSTAIKLLIGELKQEVGTVFRHSGMRMAYVAQHAFHHLEKHLDKTATDYILWRFAGNDDRESLENQSKEVNVDEEALRAVKWCVDSKTGGVRKVVVGEKGDIPVTHQQQLF